MFFLQNIVIIFTVYMTSLGLTAAARSILKKRAMLDRPNTRSSHKKPVPRGGGLALLVILIPGMLAAGLIQHNLAEHMGLIAGTIILAVISWRDNRKGVSAGRRLSLHLLAACLGSLAFAPDAMLFAGALPFWLDRVIMIVGWAWFINLYNFMDGIDGITSIETVAIANGVALVMSLSNIGNPFAETVSLLLTGTALGFLVFNWYPAKIFLGDVGSVPLGYLCGFLLLTLAVKGQWAPALIIPLYYLADSGITLARRALRREKVWQAHREHFYQQAAQALGRHDVVVVCILLTDIVLVSAAIFAVIDRTTGLGLGLISVACLLAGLSVIGKIYARR